MNPVSLDDAELERRLAALPPDALSIHSLLGGTLRLATIQGTRAVALARAAHRAEPFVATALGHALVLAGLYASTLKGADRVSLVLESDGPLAGFSVEGAADGSVRGSAEAGSATPASLDPAAWIGRGTLSASRFIAGAPRPFVGQVELVEGGPARNLAELFLRSEQTRSAVAVGVRPDRLGRPEGAGGMLLQAMPGADDIAIERAEKAFGRLPPIGSWFADGGDAGALVERTFAELSPVYLGTRPFRFDCPCSKERFAASIEALGEGLRELAENGPWPVETVCKACGSIYLFERDELVAMLEAKRP
ncbi:MAG: Hsp33 family molecular chaperone HslO [Spirochaetales bacterium]|nr:Hsp33 family molecular chaperone HslO [Spirochaetales bacterium]